MPNIDDDKIVAQISQLKCKIHNKNAIPIVQDGGGPIFLNCCCMTFEAFLNDQYYNKIELQMSGEE